MGRKKKEIPPSKTRKFSFRMTDDLYDVISTYAERANISMTEYIRTILIDKEPVIHYEIVFDNQELLKALKDLGKVGNNLNQIARYLNQGGIMTEEIKQEIMKCISGIYNMRDNIQEMAGNYRGNH